MTDLLSIFLRAAFAHDHSRNDILFELDNYDMTQQKNVMPCEEMIKDNLRRGYSHLTEEKLSQIMSLYSDEWRYSPNGDEDINFFYSLVHFTERKACLHDQQLRVKLEELFRWRKLACAIGEDLLSCAWLAYRFRWTNQNEWDRKWDISCGVDDPDLQYIFSRKGLADLHHHLKASTDVFSISWICLMNHITHRYQTFEKVDCKIPELYILCYQAARIRTVLYEYLCGISIKERICDIIAVNYDLMEKQIRKLQYQINTLALENGGIRGRAKYDYAVPKYVDCDKVEEYVFDGERSLIYGILRAIYRGSEDSELLSQLFYFYMRAKTSMRTYMVQINNRVGFTNFSMYERRKEMLLNGYPEYERLLSLLPVIEGERFHHMRYLETRITPKTELHKMDDSVRMMVADWNRKLNDNTLSPFLITHFIKCDEEKRKEYYERHHNLRMVLKRQTLSLMTLRRTSHVLFDRLVGIDAANTELDCRPEVFAHAYRYIRKHADDVNQNRESEILRKQLHYTYHVGEDFYDIVDGLRAIDEAVSFLELSRGDRLGHCIALGIDAMSYYQKYDFKIVCKKQYLLDNIAWLITHADKYNVSMPSALNISLREKYHSLVYELFNHNVDLDAYQMSMLLRGDDPQVSHTDNAYSHQDILRDWDSCALSYDERLGALRKIDDIVQLYHDYHYNKQVRIEGDKMTCMTVDREYAQCVNAIQNKMMSNLSDLGIVIECCPSSNLMIGLPERYDEQPIFRFCPVRNNSKRIAVTINTDDLGIFQTSVDNEFSMMALAALKIRDKNGGEMYRRHEVMQWIEEICENGFKYSFNA